MAFETLPGEGQAPRTFSRERPLSLSYYTVPELDVLEAIAVASDMGCRHVGLRLLGGQPGGSEMPLMTDAALRRQARLLMADLGVTALDANTARIVAETEIESFQPFLDVAAELGAKHVLATADDADENRLTDKLRWLCDAASARGLTIDLEFVPWLSVADLLGAAETLRRCDHPAIGIALDALHFHRSGSDLTILRDLPLTWFRYLQLCDAPERATPQSREALIREAVEERLLPGDGAIDLAGLLQSFPPELPLALEIPQATLAKTLDARARVARVVSATRSLLDGIDWNGGGA